jgi:hypothetical protein
MPTGADGVYNSRLVSCFQSKNKFEVKRKEERGVA